MTVFEATALIHWALLPFGIVTPLAWFADLELGVRVMVNRPHSVSAAFQLRDELFEQDRFATLRLADYRNYPLFIHRPILTD